MLHGEVWVGRDPRAVAEEGALRFSAAAERAIAARGRFRVALAGGSTPRLMYERLAEPPWLLGIAWPRVDVFFGDERTVPPDHPQSNYRMAREALLDRVAASVFRIAGERPPEQAAREYQERLLGLPWDGEPAVPRLDLVLLGVGTDGHTASLFPGTAALAEREELVVANYVATQHTWRITMTLPLLNRAREVIVVACGADKAPVLRVVAAAPADPPAALAEERPVLLVRPAGTMTWLLDEQAR